MKAILKTYRQSPRKARLLATLISGKKVLDAKHALMFADKRSAPIFLKLLNSAIANAKQNFSVDTDTLFVTSASVNKGVTLKRSMPRARGSAFPINKRTSHIEIVLGVKGVKGAQLEAPKKEIVEAKTVKSKEKKPLKTKTTKVKSK
jgi:large subunit ribosomal protein L22